MKRLEANMATFKQFLLLVDKYVSYSGCVCVCVCVCVWLLSFLKCLNLYE